MDSFLQYLSTPEILLSVVTPWCIVLCWLVVATVKQALPAQLIKVWGWCVVAAYFMAFWTVSSDVRELHIIPAFFIYEAIYLYLGWTLSATTAFSLTFLCDWIVDMCKAYSLIQLGEVTSNTFYWGVGGAGAADGLFFYPLIAAFLVRYVAFRRPKIQNWRTKP